MASCRHQRCSTLIYDLAVSLIERPDGGYLGITEYASDLYHHETIKTFIDRYLDLLHTIVKDPSTRPLGLT